VVVAAALDAATVVGVVEVVPDVAEVPAELAGAVVDDFDAVALAWFAVVPTLLRAAALVPATVVVAPEWAARPANRPVPVSAPATDQRVRCLIRRRPASRSLRLLTFLFAGRAARLFMTTIVDHGPQPRLRSR
jgi:hypothetical protein